MSKPSLLVPLICAVGAATFVTASTVKESPPTHTVAGRATNVDAGAEPTRTPGAKAPQPTDTPGSETPGASETPGQPSDSPGTGYGSGSGSGSASPPNPNPPNPDTVQLATVQTRIGVVVVGPGGRTLYRFKNDTARPSKSNCYAGCAIGFPPVIDTGDINVSGIDAALIGRVRRDDGKYQVTLAGWPLYRFNGENGPHQLLGEGVRGLWHAIAPSGEPAASAR